MLRTVSVVVLLGALALPAAANPPAASASPAARANPPAAPASPAARANPPAASASPAARANAPVATVNGTPIPPLFAEFVRQTRTARNMPAEALTPEAITDALVAQELLVQDAIRRGLDKDATVVGAIEFQRRELLSRAAMEDLIRRHPIPEATLRAEYDQARKQAGDTEYRVSHILVRTEREARDVLARLNRPRASFADLARQFSQDPSKEAGGDLGWNVPDNLVPEFARAMTGLKKGETTRTPVQTEFGWHIIRLTDTRKLDFPPFEQVRGRIANQLQQQAIRRYVQGLHAEARVE